MEPKAGIDINPKISIERVLLALKNETRALSNIALYSARRSIPNRDSPYLTTEASRILKKALNDGGIPFSKEDTGLTTCYKMGWLHRTSQEGFDVCAFPSPLHAKYTEP